MVICYSQRVNGTWPHVDSGSSSFSKWPNDQMVAVAKHCWHLVQEEHAAGEDDKRLLLDRWLRWSEKKLKLFLMPLDGYEALYSHRTW